MFRRRVAKTAESRADYGYAIVAHERRWSVEDVWALPDDLRHRYETVDGKLLVSPMPRFAHQRAVSELGLMMGSYVKRQGVGEMRFSP